MARSNAERPTNGFTVVAAVDAVSSARREVVALARKFGVHPQSETLETVELLASEVIANAVLHSAGPCDVVVTRTAERLRVEVTDTNPRLPGVVEAGPNDESGRGLLLVGAMADAWGVQPESEGKTTWFEMRLKPSQEGSIHNSAEAPSSPHAVAVRRTDHKDRLASPVKSRASSVPGTAGERHQAA